MKNSDALYGYYFVNVALRDPRPDVCQEIDSTSCRPGRTKQCKNVASLGRFCHFLGTQPLGFDAAVGRAPRCKFETQAGMTLATVVSADSSSFFHDTAFLSDHGNKKLFSVLAIDLTLPLLPPCMFASIRLGLATHPGLFFVSFFLVRPLGLLRGFLGYPFRYMHVSPFRGK
ncbi:hypothetical protein CH063_08515 [Colletotrichum higginsianum]|uniref:Uncharacterized protein n=1 Tax=Colletotrichum higginsianum (strain IMI 349063) TaxID=759273 RepID=H1VA50_COLHI|nr:hypothetical protein CH063_08515 [Colletotrichum higginsianum]